MGKRMTKKVCQIMKNSPHYLKNPQMSKKPREDELIARFETIINVVFMQFDNNWNRRNTNLIECLSRDKHRCVKLHQRK